MKRRNNQINIIKLPKMLLRWKGELGSTYAFKGILDYENWAMRQSPPDTNNYYMGMAEEITREMENIKEEEIDFDNLGMTPEQFRELHEPVQAPRNEKEKVFAQAMEVKRQIEGAIVEEDYKKAAILQKTLDVLEIRYNRL